MGGMLAVSTAPLVALVSFICSGALVNALRLHSSSSTVLQLEQSMWHICAVACKTRLVECWL